MSEQTWAVPRYFRFDELPTKVIPGRNGCEPVVWRFDGHTGGWRKDEGQLINLLGNSRADSFQLERDQFIQLTESFRERYRVCTDGPIAALYRTVAGIREQAEREGRPLAEDERALMRGLRRKTYAMFERELAARGDPGADPSPES
jgi:hypothetical protein